MVCFDFFFSNFRKLKSAKIKMKALLFLFVVGPSNVRQTGAKDSPFLFNFFYVSFFPFDIHHLITFMSDDYNLKFALINKQKLMFQLLHH